MASTPAYASTPTVWSGLVPATLDTNLTAPSNVTTLGSGGASGTKIDSIVLEGVGTTVLGLVHIFLYDGSTYHLYDTFTVTAVTVSATVKPYRAERSYSNLLVPNGWSLRCTNTIAGNQSMLSVTATGGDL